MAINLSDLLRTVQQNAYLGAGGGRKDPTTSFAEGLGATGNAISQPVEKYNEALKGFFANKKAALGLQPVGNYLGAPSQQAANASQVSMVPPSTGPQLPSSQITATNMPAGTQGPIMPALSNQAPLSPLAQQRSNLESQYGMSMNTPTELAPTIENMSYRRALIGKINSEYWQNPNDPSEISPIRTATATVNVGGQEAISNKLKFEAQDAKKSADESRMKALETRDETTRLHYLQMSELKDKEFELLNKRIQAMEAGTVQRASSKAMSDQESHPVHDFFFGRKDPASYLNSASGGQSPAPITATDPKTGHKVTWDGTQWR